MLRLIFRLLYTAIAFIEVVLIFRIVLSFMDPDMSNSLVSWVYYLSDIFMMPFKGITAQSMQIESLTIETTPIIALLAYIIIAFILSELVKAFNSSN